MRVQAVCHVLYGCAALRHDPGPLLQAVVGDMLRRSQVIDWMSCMILAAQWPAAAARLQNRAMSAVGIGSCVLHPGCLG